MAHKAAPTIMLAVDGGYSARYLLRTAIFRALKQAGARIVILTPNADEEYFRREFEDHNVHVEMLQDDACISYYTNSQPRRLFLMLRQNALSARGDLITLDDKKRDFRLLFAHEHRWHFRVFQLLVQLLKRSQRLRHALIWMESALFAGNLHREVFEKYRPDLVITCSLGTVMADALVMREGKRHAARTVAVILSWDNPSSKGLGGVNPDHVVAWTETMRQELQDYHDISPERVFVGGIAQFDGYFAEQGHWSRAEFCRRFDLDPSRPVILFAAKSPRPYPNHEVIEALVEGIQSGQIAGNPQVLVRVHPGYFTPDQRPAREYVLSLAQRYPMLRYSVPKILSDKLVVDMPASQMDELDAILRYSDVMVNLFSTMAIEAAIFDLPIVNVCYDGDQPPLPATAYRSIHIDEAQVHNQRIVRTGGTRQAYSKAELYDWVNRYLQHRELDTEGRARIVAQEAGPNHGRAGERTAEFLLGLVGLEPGRASRAETAPFATARG